MPKFDKDGVRLCDQQDCETPAFYTFVWTNDWQCNCRAHTQGMMNLAEHMGHGTPRATLRMMTADEMIPDAEPDAHEPAENAG